MAYEGMFECRQCGSMNTRSNTIATSDKAIWFDCGDCGKRFAKLARLVSPLSKTLQGMAKELNGSKLVQDMLNGKG